jgi:putative ABC transport system ATP-binding protein
VTVLAPHPAQAAMQATAPDIVQMSGVRFAWAARADFRLTIEKFAIQTGERLLLTGPSGGGKSTFLSLLAGIVAPQAGRIAIDGTDIARLSGSKRDRFRAEHFGIIFQMFNLLPYGTVLDNVLLPLSFSARRRERAAAKGGAEAEARRLLGKLGIEASLIGAPAASLSVGQQQRVAAARALIGAPGIIVADEPTSALDRNRQDTFLALLFDVVAEAGATLVMVSHDETLAPRFSRVAALDGVARIERDGGAA